MVTKITEIFEPIENLIDIELDFEKYVIRFALMRSLQKHL